MELRKMEKVTPLRKEMQFNPGDQVQVNAPQHYWIPSVDSVDYFGGATFWSQDNGIIIDSLDGFRYRYKFRAENGLWWYGCAPKWAIKKKCWRKSKRKATYRTGWISFETR
jgi:hypothetical protein